jgi:hypothetical protein
MKDITEKAMLVKLKVRGTDFGTTKKDKSVAESIAAQYGADSDAGSYNKRLIAKRFTEELGRIGREAKDFHRSLTLPWDDDGERILPVEVYFDYMQKMRSFKAEYQLAVHGLRDQWNDAMNEARSRLGKMFKEDDYSKRSAAELFCLHPDTGEYLRFAIDLKARPIPVSTDFRVMLNREESDKVKQEIERQYRETIRDAVTDLWDRVQEPIENLRDKMAAYNSGDLKTFQSAWVNNVKAVIDVVPRLNVTGDEKLDQLCRDAQNLLCSWNADQLKASQPTREFIAKSADDILAQMAGYTGLQEAA